VAVGDILAEKYRVEKVLGAGAMGVLVAARHLDLREVRAIKLMLPSMLDDADGVERFLREARAAVCLKSEHVARIHDVGRLGSGAPYIVMEYLEGRDLKSVLEARGALPVAEAVSYLLQVCDALAEAHALGIVHRDLKPANLFLTTGPSGAGTVKVLDFGVAKVPRGQAPDAELTAATMLLGTPLYMSPEQMRSARDVDARSDLWSLGVVLYRMLTGKMPFSGGTVTEICASVVADPPDPPTVLRPDLPPALGAVVMRCLEKVPAERFQSAGELASALAPFAEATSAPLDRRVAGPAGGLSTEPVPATLHDPGATLPPAAAPPGEQRRRRPAALWLGFAVTLAAGAGIAFAWLAPATPEETCRKAAACCRRRWGPTTKGCDTYTTPPFARIRCQDYLERHADTCD
jgi:serine/threonine-protein kinase